MSQFPQFHRSFTGAVLLAREIKRRHPELHKDHRFVSASLKGLVEKYKPGYSLTIVKKIDDLNSLSFVYLNEAEKLYTIAIPESFNYCYSRFALCKEICHILTDDVSVRARSASDELFLAKDPRDRVIACDKSAYTRKNIKAEEFCMFLALELLLIDEWRDNIVVDSALRNVSYYDFAKLFSVPEALIRFYVESEYHDYWIEIE